MAPNKFWVGSSVIILLLSLCLSGCAPNSDTATNNAVSAPDLKSDPQHNLSVYLADLRKVNEYKAKEAKLHDEAKVFQQEQAAARAEFQEADSAWQHGWLEALAGNGDVEVDFAQVRELYLHREEVKNKANGIIEKSNETGIAWTQAGNDLSYRESKCFDSLIVYMESIGIEHPNWDREQTAWNEAMRATEKKYVQVVKVKHVGSADFEAAVNEYEVALKALDEAAAKYREAHAVAKSLSEKAQDQLEIVTKHLEVLNKPADQISKEDYQELRTLGRVRVKAKAEWSAAAIVASEFEEWARELEPAYLDALTKVSAFEE